MVRVALVVPAVPAVPAQRAATTPMDPAAMVAMVGVEVLAVAGLGVAAVHPSASGGFLMRRSCVQEDGTTRSPPAARRACLVETQGRSD